MTKQELREAISRIIKQELNEGGLYMSPARAAYMRGYEDGKQGKPVDMKAIEDLELYENAPSKPAPTTKPTVAPGKPAEKKPRRPLGKPVPVPAKATMKEAEMLKQVIKRFKSKE